MAVKSYPFLRNNLYWNGFCGTDISQDQNINVEKLHFCVEGLQQASVFGPSLFLVEEVAGGLHLSQAAGIKSIILTEAPLKKSQWLAERPGATVRDSCRWHRREVI